MGQNNDPKERGDRQGQQGVVRNDQKPGPASVSSVHSHDGIEEPSGGEADKPGQSPHDESADEQSKD